MIKVIKIFFPVILFLTFSGEAISQDWIINGTSEKRSVRCFTVTYEEKNQYGSVWWPDKLDLSQPFELNYVIYMGMKDGNGADGMAFVMHQDSKEFDAFGDKGGGLGYGVHPSQSNTKRIAPSVTIEFDTWYNKKCGTSDTIEIKEDHTTVVYNGETCSPEFPPIPIKPAFAFADQNVEDDQCHDYTIRWTPNPDNTQTIQMFIDGHEVFTFTDDMINGVFGGDTNVFYGFTGSTGGSINEQTICLIGGNSKPFAVDDTASTPLNTPVSINVVANDYDTDGDVLDTLNIVTPPVHGVINSTSKEGFTYTPNSDFVGLDSVQYVVCDINSFKCYAKCDTATILIDVYCVPYDINAAVLSDNSKCLDSLNGVYLPDNGRAEASVTRNGAATTTGFTFHWFHDDANKVQFTGAQNNNIRHGINHVYAVNDTWGCISDTLSVMIDSTGITPDFTIVENHKMTNCKVPNGELEVSASEIGMDVTNYYDFTWYKGTQTLVDQHGTGKIAYGLEGTVYTVFGQSRQNGCYGKASSTVESLVDYPGISVQSVKEIKNCKNLNEGAITVKSDDNDDSLYEFKWYEGSSVKPTGPDYIYNGPELTGLNQGFYTATATLISSGCTSIPVTAEVIDKTVTPVVQVTMEHPSTSCIPTEPNGRLSAVASGGNNSNTVFKWYNGNNQVNHFATGPVVDNLVPGIYTVVYSGNAMTCDGVAQYTLSDSSLNISVNLDNVVAQTFCDPANGSVQVSAAGGYGSYDFYWYNLDPGLNPDTLLNDYKGALYQSLHSGDYWVVAVDRSTRCSSDPLRVAVPDNLSPIINIVETITPQTSCLLSSPNGRLSVEVDSNNSNYTFRWFKGTFAPGTSPSGNGLYANSRSATSSNLEAIKYTVFIKSTITGCEVGYPMTIPEQLPVISASFTTIDQTFCNPANGRISASASGGNGSNPAYDFYWFNTNPGNSPDSVLNDHKGQFYDHLEAANYWMIAVDQFSRCASTVVAPVVNANLSDFGNDITITTTDQSSCIPASPNGKIEAGINGGIVNDYTFRWFSGQFATGTIPVGSGIYPNSRKETDPELNDGIYTVFVKSNITGCEYGKEVILQESFQNVSLVAQQINPQTHCDPPNGEVSATASGGYGLAPSYNYYWYDKNPGSNPDISTANYIGANYNNQESGEYFVMAQDQASGCFSQVESTLLNHSVTPFAVSATAVPQSSCLVSAPNGQISAHVNNNISDYTFRWFSGQFATGTIPSGAGLYTSSRSETDYELEAGIYTVFAKNIVTGCEYGQEVIIEEIPQQIAIITKDVVNQSHCNLPNGSVTAEASGGYGSSPVYNYYWYNMDPGSNPGAGSAYKTGNTANNLDNGEYWVFAVDQATGCQSEVISDQVLDQVVPFTVATSVDPQSSCLTSNPNGQIFASVSTGNTSDYDFRWFSGQFASGSIPAGTGLYSNSQSDTDPELSTGVYTVFARHKVTGCEYSAEAVVTESLTNVTVSIDHFNDQTTCVPLNGSVAASATGGYGSSPSFTYYWYDVNPGNFPDTLSYNYRGSSYQDLKSGTYYVLAVDNDTRCQSSVINQVIASPPIVPAIVFESNKDYATCDPAFPNGHLEASVSGVTSGYTFEWFAGNNTDPTNKLPAANPAITISGSDDQIIELLSPGSYTVQVTDQVTGCTQIGNDVINSVDPVNPVLSTMVNDVTLCFPFNGSIEANATVSGGPGTAGFTYFWYEGKQVDASKKLTNSSYLADQLGLNTYVVYAQDNNTKCYSDTITERINEVNPPSISFSNITVDCNVPSGGVTANAFISGAEVSDGYKFEWFAGLDTVKTNNPIISTDSSASGLQAGVYTIIVTNKTTNCRADDIINLSTDDITTPKVTAHIGNSTTTCGGNEGEISLSISVNSSFISDYQNYRMEWNKLSLDSIYIENQVRQGNASNVFSNLNEGIYIFTAQSTLGPNKCFSKPDTVTIIDPPSPDLSVSGINNTICSPATPNGELSVQAATSAGEPPSGYNYIVYDNSGVELQRHENVLAGTLDQFQNLQPHHYKVIAENSVTFCRDSSYFRIKDKTIIPIIQNSLLLDETYCVPNGEVEIATISTGGDMASDYSYSWFKDDLSSSPMEDGLGNQLTSFQIDKLTAGKYFVKAERIATNCISDPFQVELKDLREFPVIDLVDLVHQTTCAPVKNGSIQVNATQSNPYTYTFNWTGSGSFSSSDNGVASNKIDLLDVGVYQLEVINETTSCVTNRSFEVKDQIVLPTVNLVSLLDQTYCIGNGMIEVEGIHADNPGFTYEWYRNDITNLLYGTVNETLKNVSADDYLVKAVRTDLECKSAPLQLTVEDEHTDPIISLVGLINQTSCDLSAPNGSIHVEAIEQIAGTDQYRFSWSSSEIDDPAITSTISNKAQGQYTVEVLNKNTQCTAQATYEIKDKIVLPTVQFVNAVDQTDCIGNASIEVSGQHADNPAYLYQWYQENLSNLIATETSATIAGLSHGTYYVIAKRDDPIACESAPLQINVDDIHVNPVINLIANVSQTSCGTPNGEIRVEAIDLNVSHQFTFSWSNGTVHSASVQSNLVGLTQGSYLLEVENESTACTSNASFDIVDKIVLPTVKVDNLIPQSDCIGNGSISASGQHQDDPIIYSYEWYREGVSTPLTHTGATLANLPSGTYAVVAVRTDAIACKSLPIQVYVDDIHTNPVINFDDASLVRQLNCFPETNGYTGQITALAAEADGSIGSYNFNWSHPSATVDVVNINAYSSKIIEAHADKYSLQVQNTITQCISNAAFTISQNLELPDISFVDKADDSYCKNGNGAIEVLAGPSQFSFAYQWFRMENDTPEVINGTSGEIIEDLVEGDYLVKAIRLDNHCESSDLAISVEDISQLPVVSMSVLAEQMAVTPAIPTGKIEANARETDGSFAGYRFDWYLNDQSFSHRDTITADTLNNLAAGLYSLEVENLESGCFTNNRIALSDNPAEPAILDLNISGMALCQPANGSVEVVSVSLNDDPDSLNNYIYYWYKEAYYDDLSMADYIISGDSSTLVGNLGAGTYYVVAWQQRLNVTSLPVQIKIEDIANYPAIDLLEKQNQTSCDPSMQNGYLKIMVDNTINPAGYNFNWFEGINNSSSRMNFNTDEASQLAAGAYSVEVTSLTTGCSKTKSFLIQEEKKEIFLVASGSDNMNCVDPNGKLFGSIVNEPSTNFEYLWYQGAQINDNSQPDYQGQSIENIPSGFYSAIAFEKTNPSCYSDPVLVKIEDLLSYPDLEVILDAPLSNCDINRANGQLSMSMDDDISFYTIQWYDHQQKMYISDQAFAKKLNTGDFHVEVKHMLTGCSIHSDTIFMPVEQKTVPLPNVNILSEFWNCEYPTGSAEAFVDGKQAPYLFTWYDQGEQKINVDVNYQVDQLEVGQYAVRAEDRLTGCISEAVSFHISDDTFFPDFDIFTTKALCLEASGTAYVEVQDPQHLDKVFWYNVDNDILSSVSEASELVNGEYFVEVIANNGCATQKAFSIDNDVNVFNGISANGDGINDYFIIDCIESYPQNQVKIFNRSGTLVYEIINYDNNHNTFRGRGNKGLYISGDELPIGTYFYIIDLNDQSKPKTGYLELMR